MYGLMLILSTLNTSDMTLKFHDVSNFVITYFQI